MTINLGHVNYFDRREGPLGVEVTTYCNSECSHCFARAGFSKYSSLSTELVKDIITEGYNEGYLHLHITGGEPLLWEGLYEVLDNASELGYETIFLNTNGKLLSGSVSRKLLSYGGLCLSVSLEGPEALHDLVRGEGSYRLTTTNIEKALEVGLDLFIFMTVRKSLIGGLPRFADETFKRFPGIRVLSLIQLTRVADDTLDLSKELLTPDEFLQMVQTAALLNLYGHNTSILSNPLAVVASKLLKMPWITHSHSLYREGSIIVMANRDICLSHSNRGSFGKFEKGKLGKVLSSEEYRNATSPDNLTCPTCRHHEICLENSMIKPSEWFRDMFADRPYCKKVLDRASAL